MKKVEFDNCFRDALSEIESSEEFKNIDCRITGVFYTLYSRCKRLYFAMNVLKDSDDENVNYTEINPLLRVFIESYFHISYVMSEKDMDKVEDAYKHLSIYSGKLIAGKLQHSEQLGQSSEEFIGKFDLKYKLPKEYDFFDDMGKLAAKTGKRDIYRRHYSILSSFIHFNPATFINYGDFQDNKFIYNIENIKERWLCCRPAAYCPVNVYGL
jgi:hypothetical protein